MPHLERAALLQKLGVRATFMGVGVDRIDYTKGILERFLAVERLLDEESAALGELEVQLGKPIRLQTESLYVLDQYDVVLM